MPLPQAVRKGAERAAQLIAASGAKPAAPVVLTTGTPPKPAPSAPAPTPPQPAAGDTVESLQAKLNAAQAELDKSKSDLAAANQRSSVLKGKYDSEVSGAHTRAKTAEARVLELETQLNKKIEAGTVTSLTENERKLAGEDLLSVVTKVAREVASDTFNTSIKPVNERVERSTRMTEATYDALLNTHLPDFDLQNEDPLFIQWLNGVDPASGHLRNELLQRAHGGMQGHQVVEIFRAYREKREIGVRTAQPEPKQPSIDPGPGQHAVVPSPLEGEKKTISRREIAAFYAEKRKGLWKDREAEARKFEQDIALASAENRIV